MSYQLKTEDLLLAILLGIIAGILWNHYQDHRTKQAKKKKKGPPREWQPRNPKKCPACQAGVCLPALHPKREVIPWREVKSRRGRKKTVKTEGHCCLNPRCAYVGITDAAVHALVGNGKDGKHKDIQLLRCQCCQSGFTSRRDTPLYYLKTAAATVEMCLWLLAEGIDEATLVRFTGHGEATLSRWLTRAGEHSERLHQVLFVNLTLDYIQVDELKAPIIGDKENWLWAAIEPVSKIVPAIHVGKRSTDEAMIFIHLLVLCLAPGCVPAFTSDGLRQYFYALTAHFGHWRFPQSLRAWIVSSKLLYGQVVKRRHKKKGDGQSFVLTRMMAGQRRDLIERLLSLGLTETIQTAIIERWNLTIRHGVAALARRTWSKARSNEALYLHIQWWRSYYHFSRMHETLSERARPCTPAMAAGLTDHVWSVGDILRMPLAFEGGAA